MPGNIGYSSSSSRSPVKTMYARHGGYDSNQIYGSESNYISRAGKFKPDQPILPSKMDWKTPSRPQPSSPTRKYSNSSAALSYNPHKYTTSSSKSYRLPEELDIVRPSMRDRTGRYSLPDSLTETQSNYSRGHSRSTSLSPTNAAYVYKSRESTLTHQYGSGHSRSNSTSDLKYGTGKLSPSMPPRNSTLLNGSVSGRSKDEISIDASPYKGTSYKPSFASTRTPSPKRPHDTGYKINAMSYHRKARDNGHCSYSCTGSEHLVSHYSRSSSSKKGYAKNENTGTTGLKNIGNTCFMNSIIQCLSNTKALKDYCLKFEYTNEINSCSPMKGKLMKAFAEIIQQLWEGSTTPVTPSNFKSQIQKFSPRFMGYEQQDSQEFLRFLLEGLHEDINQVVKKSSEPLRDLSHKSPQEKARETWKWYGKKDRSFIFDLFVGQLESSLECVECGHVSLTYDPFWDLSLPISKSTFSSESTTLNDCLRNFTKEETLDRDEKPMCEKCRVRRRMKKRLSIHRFPKILVIHLKRFNEGSRYRQKLSNLVKFPVKETLKLSHFTSDTCEDKSSTTYELYAVSNHCGSCYGGHYTAYCMNPHLQEWHEFNDSRVTSTSEFSICTKEAYVLFYVRNERSARL